MSKRLSPGELREVAAILSTDEVAISISVVMTDRSFVRERSCCCQFDDPLGSPLAFDHPGSERLAALVSRRPAHSVRGTLAALLTLRVAVLSSSGMDRTLGPFHSRPCLVVLPRYVGGAGRGRTLGEPGRCKHRSGLCLRERSERRPASRSPRSGASRTVSPSGERGAQQVPGAERAGASLPSLNTACSSFLTH